ncbi:C signal [Agrobacterium sp. DSM 25558]|uniref:SDR family NAD(P)-dependent oxidoreductase n=1 Tax=Agrobacterium sp. DSM 25558 TaxID=1907665 RepID=UPI0009725ECD|nr:SDR family NAD(P)-dependent oxidoreductase [Agrobacterium sp. DSM 25558]SCX19787.1 C signal [Agrobacterium sp. DSM 25558]
MKTQSDPLLTSLPSGFGAVIIGASGGIGSALCARLQHEPHVGEVIALSRSEGQIDLLDETSIEKAAQQLQGKPIQLLICATGVLDVDGHPPEKSLKQVDPDIMLREFSINAVGPALIAKHFLPLLDRKKRAIVAFLSARVGSIGDNRLGGWISYRASKAALNQIVRTASIEYARTHPEIVLTAIHPGTVRTNLSRPYAGGHRTVSPDEAAASILTTLNALGPETSGSFIAYDGSAIPW